jgi:histidinol dehydrogenase
MVMRTIVHGSREHARWRQRLPRTAAPRRPVLHAAETIVRAVARGGDAALVRLTERLDGVRLTPARLRVRPAEIQRLARRADRELVAALERMAAQVEAFHRQQLAPGFRRELPDGSWLEEVVRPLGSAGLYVPGGAGAYPSSVLMNAIPAKVAGVPRLVVVTPPRSLEDNPAVAAALLVAGVEEVYRVGGAQAVAALAFGTRTIPSVHKIVGPGNAYVAAAKRLVRGRVEIDSEAGPSEVAILADETADPGVVAADLLAQAEHGSGDETVVLVTPSRELAAEAARLVEEGLRSVANAARARRAVSRNGAVILVDDLEQGLAVVNELAAEHVEVMTRQAERMARRVVGGAVFAGEWTPVAVGDYGIGPNHVLPTGGAARFASPLSVRDFQRRQSLVRLTRDGLARVTDDVVRVAMAEGFRGHAQSVLARFEAE